MMLTTSMRPIIFVRPFNLDAGELSLVDSLRVRMRRDDGAIIYINGTEVVRDNLPDGEVDNTTFADVTANVVDEGTYFEFDIDFLSPQGGG